jgi:uncharacterized protein
MKRLTAQQVITLLALKPLEIEGGYFCETYRSRERVPAAALPRRYQARRPFATAIYYLLTAGSFSALHRLRSDEVFHFYAGDPVEMLLLGQKSAGQNVILGGDLKNGQRPQVIVPRGVWQGARLARGGEWALLGTTVAPGFEYADFELGMRGALSKRYPRYAALITALTRI